MRRWYKCGTCDGGRWVYIWLHNRFDTSAGYATGWGDLFKMGPIDGPQITTVGAVLRSPWLMFHVAVIVAAYGFFGIGLLLGL